MERLELLDWLRALAIALVLFGHTTGPIAPGGAVGVSVFFVLSGYLIASIMMRDGMLSPNNMARFIGRRLGRIYPMFLLQLACATAYVLIVKPEHAAPLMESLPRLMTFTGAPDVWLGYGFGVLWTLLAEFWFYATFPILLWVAVASRHVFGVLALAATVSLASKFKFPDTQFFALLYYDHFLIGVFVFALIQRGMVPRFHRRAIYLGLGLVLVAATAPYPGSRNAYWYAQSLCAAVGTGLIILAAHVDPIFKRIPAVAYIGRISYSIYLVHALLIDVFPRLSWNMPIYLTTVLAISALTYRFIERPCVALARRYLPFALPARRMASEGDSITASENSFAYLCAAQSGSALADFRNLAVTNSVVAGFFSRADALDCHLAPGGRNLLMVTGGNDLLSDSPTAFTTALGAYIDARRAAGWTVAVCTTLPRTEAQAPGFNAKRSIANATIRSWAGTRCHAVIDFDRCSMGMDSGASNPAKYADGVHPTNAGHARLAAYAKPILDAIKFPFAGAVPRTVLAASSRSWESNSEGAVLLHLAPVPEPDDAT